MSEHSTPRHRVLSLKIQRWLIPIALSVVGMGFTIGETILGDGHSIGSEQAVMGFLLLGVIGPALAFGTLTWALQGLQYWEQVQRASERQRQQLFALNQISAAVNQSLDLDAVLNRAIDCVLEVMQLSSGEVFLIQEQHLQLGAARGVSAAFLQSEQNVKLGQCACGKCALGGELIAMQDLQNIPSFSNAACAREGFSALVSVPVRTSERVIGVIHLASHMPREFDSEDRALLTSIGSLIGTAVEKAQLHTELGLLNRDLETRVAERTLELERAKQDLAEKAEMLSEVLAAERRVEEKTRAEIAADLHDGVQQLIVGALFEIQSARDAATQNPQIVPTRLQATQDLLRRIGVEMRRAIHSLHPVALDAQGLVPAIRECAERFERVTGIGCEFKVEGAPQRFAPEVEVAAFRIAQEALNNAIAHAQARRVRVDLGFDASALSLQVSDDGAGFDVRDIRKQIGAHLGLIGMRERAASVGGSFEIESRPGEGTRVMLHVPFEKSVQPAEFLMVESL